MFPLVSYVIAHNTQDNDIISPLTSKMFNVRISLSLTNKKKEELTDFSH